MSGAVYGNTAIAGAYGDDGVWRDSGAIKVYRRNSVGEWPLVDTLVPRGFHVHGDLIDVTEWNYGKHVTTDGCNVFSSTRTQNNGSGLIYHVKLACPVCTADGACVCGDGAGADCGQ